MDKKIKVCHLIACALDDVVSKDVISDAFQLSLIRLEQLGCIDSTHLYKQRLVGPSIETKQHSTFTKKKNNLKVTQPQTKPKFEDFDSEDFDSQDFDSENDIDSENDVDSKNDLNSENSESFVLLSDSMDLEDVDFDDVQSEDLESLSDFEPIAKKKCLTKRAFSSPD